MMKISFERVMPEGEFDERVESCMFGIGVCDDSFLEYALG